jgi:hypothetical protein
MADAATDTIRPTDLATALNCSVPYASQMLSGARKITMARALLIYDRTGHKLGPIAEATPKEIAMLRKFAVAA